MLFQLQGYGTGADKIGESFSEFEREALDFIVETADRPDIRFDMALEQGDIQLINNYTVLHSRSDFVDYPEPERKRNMLRMWINFHVGRPLVPAFADRFNTGARGDPSILRKEAKTTVLVADGVLPDGLSGAPSTN